MKLFLAGAQGCTRVIVFLIFCSLGSYAQQRDSVRVIPEDTARHLKEVIIHPDKATLLGTSPSPLQILYGGQLERMNSLSVADAIRYFSGVQLKDYGGVGGLKTINVRSLGSNHTAVFYDGVELGNAQNGQVDLGKFSLDNIEEISLYNGQKSSIFQSAKGFASGSSLYLTAKQPTFAPGKKDNEKISLRSGSFGLVDPSLLWQHQISNNIFSSISTEWIHANGRYRFKTPNGDSSAIRHNGDVDAQRIEGGLGGKMSDSSSWSVRTYLYNSNRGLPGATVANRFDYPQRQWDRDFFVQGSYRTTLGSYSLLANAKYANDYTRFLDPEFVTLNGFLDNRFHQQEVYVSLANRYRIKDWWDVALSADYQQNTLDANLDHFAYPTRNTELVALATELHFDRLIIQANILGTFVNDRVKVFDAAAAKNELTPAVLLSWQLFTDPGLHLRAFYKDILRMPTFNDLYYTLIGNTYLNPEFTKQYDAGITYNHVDPNRLLSTFAFQIDAYYNQVTDKIIAVPAANLFRWTMLNLGKVQIKGLELNSQTTWQLSTNITLNTGISYTYQQALDVTGNYNYNEQIPYVPLNSGSFLAGADWRRWTFNYSFIYTGARYNLGTNDATNYIQPWYTHDAALHYAMPVSHHQLKLSVEVNNLLNQYYEVVVNFPMPGRSYRFTLNFTY
jgi:vitamin B12 transporter